jgi:hypothetical protein
MSKISTYSLDFNSFNLANDKKKFNRPYKKLLFRNKYRRRFYNYLYKNITTCQDVSEQASIPQEYLSEFQKYYEKRGLLKVVGLGICPITNYRNVQFLSTNPAIWNNTDFLEAEITFHKTSK